MLTCSTSECTFSKAKDPIPLQTTGVKQDLYCFGFHLHGIELVLYSPSLFMKERLELEQKVEHVCVHLNTFSPMPLLSSKSIDDTFSSKDGGAHENHALNTQGLGTCYVFKHL